MEKNFSFSAPTASSTIKKLLNNSSKSNQTLTKICTEYFTKDGKKLSPKKPLLKQTNQQKNKQIFNNETLLIKQIDLNSGKLNLIAEEKSLNKQQSSFPSIMQKFNLDLIFVVDRSDPIYMDHNSKSHKTTQFDLSLKAPVQQLFQTQKFLIINSSATFIQNFQNQLMELKVIEGTRINKGIKLAIEKLEERNEKSLVSVVFLFSDGLDSSTEAIIEDKVIINAFGFGTEHDADDLFKIIKQSNGRFNQIEEKIINGECFVYAQGDAKSVIANQERIQIEVENEIENVEYRTNNKYSIFEEINQCITQQQ